MDTRFRFSRSERLKSRKQIDALFKGGRSIGVAPLRISYAVLPVPADAPVQIGVTASKRAFRRATDRNRLKRLLREAYRLNKHALVQSVSDRGIGLAVFFLYTDKTITSFQVIENAMKLALKKLEQKLPAPHEKPA